MAAGKGVTICDSKERVIKISEEIFKGKFKNSNKLVLEEFLTGQEASYFLILDKNYTSKKINTDEILKKKVNFIKKNVLNIYQKFDF